MALGYVGDVMCHFFDAEGRPVPHPMNDRIMSIGLDAVRKAGHLVFASGGVIRAKAILSSIRNLGCNTLVTDEPAARQILELAK